MTLNIGIVKKGLLQGDLVVWMVFILLCMISIIEVYSASSSMTYKRGQFWDPIIEHGTYVLVGIGITWIIHLFPCNIFKAISTFSLHLIAYPLLIIALLSAATNEASRWIHIGGKTIQPSEIAKICLVGFVAFILATLRDEKGASKTAFKIVCIEVGLTLALIVTENASTAIIIGVVMFGICFFAQVRAKYLAWVAGLGASVAIIGLSVALSIPKTTLQKWGESDGPLHRVPVWVGRITDHEKNPADPAEYKMTPKNIQTTHARIAVASCNIVGKGPGNSTQRDFLPLAFSDFIYAIIIEEGGLASGAFVMFLYLLLMWRAMKIASKCKALFPAYLVMGLALMMVVQAMVNMAVAVGAFPVTGQTLPLISKGGTSTFVNCAYIGMILSVSRSAKKKVKRVEPELEIVDTTNNIEEVEGEKQ